MLKKTIKYEDFEGNQRSEDFYFHMTKTELYTTEIAYAGGIQAMCLKAINATGDDKGIKLINIIKDLIRMSYGVKSEDGRSFVKIAPDGHKLAADFEQTAAFDALFLELATDAKAAADFVNGILPHDMTEALEEARKKLNLPENPTPEEVQAAIEAAKN